MSSVRYGVDHHHTWIYTDIVGGHIGLGRRWHRRGFMARIFYTAGDSTPENQDDSGPNNVFNDESELETDTELARSPQKTQNRPTASGGPGLSFKPVKRLGTAVAKPRSNTRDSTGRLPLQKACERGDVAQVRQIIRSNPNLEDRDYAGTTALHGAALNGYTECVKLLLSAGAVVDVRSAANELDTPLIDATANGHLECVKLLLSFGADPRVPNACGRCAIDFVRDGLENSPIRLALRQRIFALRARSTPIINQPDSPEAPQQLFPPNFQSVVRPAIPSLMELSRKKVRNYIVEQAGSGHMAYVGVAIERGWKPTPDALVLASRHGHADVVGLLLAFGLSPDSEFEGTTALKEAVKRCHLSVARLLVDGGATKVRRVLKYVSDLQPDDPMRLYVEKVSKRAKEEMKSIENGSEKRTEKENVVSNSKEREKVRDGEKGRGNDHIKDLEKETDRNKAVGRILNSETSAKKRPPEISKSVLRAIKPKKRTKSVPTPLNDGATLVEADATIDLGPQKMLRHELLPPKLLTPEPLIPDLDQKATFSEPSEPTGDVGIDTVEDVLAQTGANDCIGTKGGNVKAATEIKDATTHNDFYTGTKGSVSNNAGDSIEDDATKDAEYCAKESSNDSNSTAVDNANSAKDSDNTTTNEVYTAVKDSDSTKDVTSLSDSLNGIASNLTVEKMVEKFVAPATVTTPLSPQPPAESLLHHVNDEPVTLDGQWTERSQELSRLAQLKQAQRRDREAKMLQVLTQARRPNSEDEDLGDSPRKSECAVKSPTPTLESPISPGESTLPVAPVSISHLPWALRHLAHTGKPIPVTPLISHEINGEAHLIDAQVALALGDAKLHSTHPQLHKAMVLPTLKSQLWPFCRPWLCRPDDFGPSLAEDHQRFSQLPLCWLRADEVIQQLFANSPPSIVPVALHVSAQRPSLANRPSSRSSSPSLGGPVSSTSHAAGSGYENVPTRWRRVFGR